MVGGGGLGVGDGHVLEEGREVGWHEGLVLPLDHTLGVVGAEQD